MANELKQTYAHIDADPAEMAAYRQRLAQRLISPKRAPRPRWPWLALAAAALIGALLWQGFRPQPLGQLELAALEQRIETANAAARQRLLVEARRDFTNEDPLAHRNATVALCLLLQGEEAIELAAEHLMDEPDPRYRAALLERILDLADDQGFASDHIEALMDREDDKLCLKLYRDWMRLT